MLKYYHQGDFLDAAWVNDVSKWLNNFKVTGDGIVNVLQVGNKVHIRGESQEPGVELLEVKPPTGAIQPDYRAGTLEYGNPIGYDMIGAGPQARDKNWLGGNIYSGTPTEWIYSRFDCPPPGTPVYAVNIGTVNNASGAPPFGKVYEVISSMQEQVFVTISGSIGTTVPGGTIFPSGTGVGGNYCYPYPPYGQGGTRIYPCYRRYGGGGGPASGVFSLNQGTPDSQQVYNVVWNGPWLARVPRLSASTPALTASGLGRSGHGE